MIAYRFEAMSLPLSQEVAWNWRYPPPFDFYDGDADQEDLKELLDPRLWPEVFEACFVGDEFVGFFSATTEGLEAEIGLGLRPDLTSGGRGRGFITALLGRLHELRPGVETVSLSVAAFNQRAIRAYRSCGFEVSKHRPQETNGGVYAFVSMSLRLNRAVDPL